MGAYSKGGLIRKWELNRSLTAHDIFAGLFLKTVKQVYKQTKLTTYI